MASARKKLTGIKHGKWTTENMELAIKAVNDKQMGFLKASKCYNVPKTTLRRHLKGSNQYAVGGKKHLGRQIDLPEHLEEQLVQHVLELEARFYGLTPYALRRLAYQIAEANNLHTRFNHEDKVAGKAWLRNFLKRHQEISSRLPEATSLGRASGFNRQQVDGFFHLLEDVIKNNELSASQIFNMDESGISVVQKMNRILAKKGKHQVGAITSQERGQTVTIICCNNAAGHFIPPGMIFPRVRMKAELTDGAPPGTMFTCQVGMLDICMHRPIQFTQTIVKQGDLN